MTDAIELLSTRSSFKAVALSAPGPSAAEIDKLLTIACRVPDHGKLTPWHFIVFEGDARFAAGAAIATAFRANCPDAKPEQVEFERKRLAHAPLVIAVVSRAALHVKIPEWEQVLSAGAAAMNLVLAAHERIAGFIHIGTPSGPAADRPRPPLSEIATRFSV
jgi:nitroreductase